MAFWDRWFTKGRAAVAVTPQDAFTDEMIVRIRQRSDVVRVERHPEHEFSLNVWRDGDGDGDALVMFLGNLFYDSRGVPPDQREERIERFLGIITGGERIEWQDAQNALVPLLRPASYALHTPKALLRRRFLPHVDLLLGVDSEETTQIVIQADLESWDQPLDGMYQRALDNFANYVEEADVEPYDPTAEFPIWHVAADDGYESSRLALPGFLAEFAELVEGSPIAIVPSRCQLIISGDGDVDSIGRLADAAEREFEASPRSLSPAVYTLGASGEVVPLDLAVDHPHYAAVRRGHRLLAADSYAAQKEHLDERHERDGTDIFVASLTLLQNKESGVITSYTSWTQTVDTLLPEADLVALGRPVGDEFEMCAMVPWPEVMRLAGSLLEPVDGLSPARWRCCEWPDDATLQQLVEAGVEP